MIGECAQNPATMASSPQLFPAWTALTDPPTELFPAGLRFQIASVPCHAHSGQGTKPSRPKPRSLYDSEEVPAPTHSVRKVTDNENLSAALMPPTSCAVSDRQCVTSHPPQPWHREQVLANCEDDLTGAGSLTRCRSEKTRKKWTDSEGHV